MIQLHYLKMYIVPNSGISTAVQCPQLYIKHNPKYTPLIWYFFRAGNPAQPYTSLEAEQYKLSN